MPDRRERFGKHGDFRRKLRYRGRPGQILIFLGKFLRMFIYQNDWKVFPMSALIAGLLAYVIRLDFMRTMEGTLKGSFAISCVALWNGCFNSIQVICREREIVKREHRTGMFISSYIIAHMIYQAMLCLGQTALTLYVFRLVGISFAKDGLITRWLSVDLGITIFLITYAADMLALLISAVVRNTTSAMTVMPFLLIFQLVFSGGFFSLPSWSKPLTEITISHHGLVCICAQADYNNLPMAAAWNALNKMRDTQIGGTYEIADLLPFLDDAAAGRSEMIKELRSKKILDLYENRDEQIVGKAAPAAAQEETDALAVQNTLPAGSPEINDMTVGDFLDLIATSPSLQTMREKEFSGSVSIGELIDLFGEKEVKQTIMKQSAQSNQNDIYENSVLNISGCWLILSAFALLYAFVAMIALEFVDKDKR